MATLEKIRNKSGLLVAVIGIALLSFVIGDLFSSKNSVLFSDRTTAVKVGGEKIDIMDFQRRYEEASYQVQQQGQQVDGALIQNQVINQMIQESLINGEIEENDIYVTSKELTEYMTGSMVTQSIMQFAQQMGMQTPAQLYDLIFNPMNYGMTVEQVEPYRQEWLRQEKFTEQQLKFAKYAALLTGAIQANDLDKAAIYAEMAETPVVNIVKKSYSSLSNSDYTVSDAEIQAEYEKNKNKYKTPNAFSKVRYISVDIKPSAADKAEGAKIMEDAYAKIKDASDVEAIINNSELTIVNATVTATDIPNTKLRSFVTSSKVGATTQPELMSDVYSMTKVLGKMVQTDSVMANMVIVQGTKSQQDSVLNLLNSGTSIADIQKISTVAGAQADAWIPLKQLSNNEEIVNKLIKAGKDYFPINSTESSAAFYQVTKKNAPKQMYKIATTSYKLYPSQETIDGLRNKLQEFIYANNTADKFIAEATKAGYNALSTVVSEQDAQMARIESTRDIIKWIHEAKTGSVSPLFDDQGNDKIIAVAVEDVYDQQYTPVSDPDLRQMLTVKIRNDKKAADLMAKYAGKASTVEAYADLMDAKVDEAVGVNFGQMFIPLIGMNEAKLQGTIAASELNTVVGPIQGNNAIYVFEVKSIDNASRTFNADEAAIEFGSAKGNQAVLNKVVEILKGNTEVVNNMINF
ncbi:MAG: peptidylprolyl isomerase [Bacteroidales bacterium]